MFCQGSEGPDDTAEDGQHNGNCVHQPQRGDNLARAQLLGQGPVAVVSRERHIPHCPAPSRHPEYNCGRESRVMKDRSDWKLCPAVFQEICHRFGPLEVDLFASRLSAQLPQYASWRPDPAAMTTDAFMMDWSQIQGYANPPWNLVGRVLAQTRRQQANLVLIAPVWKAQPWYAVLLGMLVRILLLIVNREDLIQATHENGLPDTIPQLAVWVSSGNESETTSFRRKLQNFYSHPGDKSPQSHTTPYLGNGLAGVIKGT